MSRNKTVTPQKADLEALQALTDPRVVTRNKVLTQLASMKKRSMVWQFETDFMKEAGINQTHVKFIRTEFARHFTEVNMVGKSSTRLTWFPDPKMAAKIRAEQTAIKKAQGQPE